MNYYLIDLENVHDRGLVGADMLTINDTIIVFYSSSASSISEFSCELMNAGGASVEFEYVNTNTKNALDFELSVYVGKLIEHENTKAIYIISEDHGYEAVIDISSRLKKGCIFQYKSILEAYYMSPRIGIVSKKRMVGINEARQKVHSHNALSELAAEYSVDPGQFNEVLELAGRDLKVLYQELLHTFGGATGLKLYQQLKLQKAGPFEEEPT